MNRKYLIIPFCFYISLLISCGKPNVDTKEIITPPPDPSLVSPVEPPPEETPTVELSPSPTMSENLPEPTVATQTPTPTLEPIFMPESNQDCMYVNYANSFPLINTGNYNIRFYYDDTVSIFDTRRPEWSYTFPLSQSIDVEGLDLTNPDLWYFCGAFQSEETIYAHYDYLNGETTTPSLLIKIIPEGESVNVSCCIQSRNPEKHFQDCFTLSGDSIFYTETELTSQDKHTTSILRTDKNGENSSTFYKGTPGETIPFMTTDGNFLSYIIEKENGVYQLNCVELTTGHTVLLSNRLAEPNFLIAWKGYIFTSNQDGKLKFYDCQTCEEKSITYTDDEMISSGYPLTDGETIYLPLVNYSENTGTILLPLDLAGCNVLDEIHVDDTYYYSIGMISSYLYTENMESFLIFNTKGQN